MPIWIDGYPFDVAVRQGSSYPGEVTDHPVDADADVNDHIRIKPTELTLDCVVSDTPTGEIATHPSRRDVVLAGEAAFDKLLEIRAKRRPVTVETPRRTYTNMGFTGLERNEDIESSGGVLFTVTLLQINFLQNKRITVRTNLGTKHGKFVAGQRILWRKGQPPGSSPATDPPGKIIGQEYIRYQEGPAGITGSVAKVTSRISQSEKLQMIGKFFHENGSELTTEELEAFTKDLNRDSALEQRRKLAKIDKRIDAIGDKIDRALKLANAKEQNPGKYIDPKLFGL